MDFARIAVEIVVGFLSLFILTKFLGKMTITQITTFDFISALVLGELVGNALYSREIGIADILFAVTCWGLLIYVTEFITQKNIRLRLFLEGQPSIIIKQGKLSYKELRKNRLDIDQLLHMLRSKDIFSIKEVQYAILETNGTLSVIRKSDYENPTKVDFNMQGKEDMLALTLISDGRLVSDNLKQAELNETWLEQQLATHNINDYSQVLYAEWKEGEPLYVEKY
ncbi:DUF421 domain-containing protein [Metabacillus iocasae]|uniref:Uncharacterized membrane protein YcaP (DUF421 family) n=1 Tax=Priestia iocasae TaxID=2291674 RepID=A0ABS2QST2_9BACI|nr:DUF421 domain-containing protein [Metabacillus iocasae]MBM7702525.1 uncharacterized membrane protein YcaP (DUF421 family) [Metabacillus iocasae]